MTTDKYLYHDGVITIPESFKELSDIVMRYEGTPCAEIAIEAFEYWNLPMIKWPSGVDITNQSGNCLTVAKMIATWSHNYHLAVKLGEDDG